MDNKKTDLEQLKNSEQVQENDDIEERGTKGSEEMSSKKFGKFKDAESLFEAYNSLQKEFTRKCQKLSDFEKKYEDNATKEPSNVNLDEKLIKTLIAEETEKIAPSMEVHNWNEKVVNFLMKNENAKEFSREISEEIINDRELRNNPNALEVAYGRIITRKYRTPKEIAKDKDFLESYIYRDEDIKKSVLDIYIKEISQNKTPPVITNAISGAINLSPKNKPRNLEEAKKMVEKLLNLN